MELKKAVFYTMNTPAKNPDLTIVKRIRAIHTSGTGSRYSAEREVNECISHGWILLSLPYGEFSAFVVGWTLDNEPPQTEWQKLPDHIRIPGSQY